MKPNALGFRVAERPGLVPDGVRHAEPPQVMHKAGPADRRGGPVAQAEDARGFPG